MADAIPVNQDEAVAVAAQEKVTKAKKVVADSTVPADLIAALTEQITAQVTANLNSGTRMVPEGTPANPYAAPGGAEVPGHQAMREDH